MEYSIQIMQFVALITVVVALPGIVSALNSIAQAIRDANKK